MELFTREATLVGPPGEVMDWTGRVTDAFEDATGTRPATWVQLVGGRAGTVTWSMPIDGLTELLQLRGAALGDREYLAVIDEGQGLISEPAVDSLLRPYEGSIPEGRPRAGNVAMITTATSRAGELGAAVGWGLEIAHHASVLTGITTTLYGTAAGGFSRLVWATIALDPSAADDADRQLRADDEYRKLIARGGSHFVSGSATTSLHVCSG